MVSVHTPATMVSTRLATLRSVGPTRTIMALTSWTTGSHTSWWGPMLCNTRALFCITTSNGLSSVSVCDEMLCPLLTPSFPEEISPFLRIFSGRYATEKTPHHLFAGILDCHGSGEALSAAQWWP